jgi:hypothetical protein
MTQTANDVPRAAVAEVFDLADRAGVALTYVAVSYPAAGLVYVTVMAGRDMMRLTDALRIALRACGTRATIRRDDPTPACPHTAHRVRTRCGVELTLVCQPTYADMVAQAALQA